MCFHAGGDLLVSEDAGIQWTNIKNKSSSMFSSMQSAVDNIKSQIIPQARVTHHRHIASYVFYACALYHAVYDVYMCVGASDSEDTGEVGGH